MEIEFESVAEEHAYPIIKRLAEKLGLRLTYQHSFHEWSYKDWVYRKYGGVLPAWIVGHLCENHRGHSVDCMICYWYQDCRADFTLTNDELRVAIEVQSKEFHQDPDKDLEKRRKVESHGYHVLYVDAVQVIWQPDEAYFMLRNQIQDLRLKTHPTDISGAPLRYIRRTPQVPG